MKRVQGRPTLSRLWVRVAHLHPTGGGSVLITRTRSTGEMATRREDVLDELERFERRERKEPGPLFNLVIEQFERQGRVLNPPPPTETSRTVVPTVEGEDLENVIRTRDAHVQLEDDEISVDVFDSMVDDPGTAHVDSDSFPNTREGAEGATEYLRSFFFDVRVVPSRGR